MQVNVTAPFLLTQACLPLLQNAGKGSIVFTLDAKDRAYWGTYGVSKAALRSLMHVLAHALDVRDSRHPQCIQPFNESALGIRVLSMPTQALTNTRTEQAR
jgi:NAD(P)-dependent dehydrogenase (short-subunit alcohol dehydrogenase family)